MSSLKEACIHLSVLRANQVFTEVMLGTGTEPLCPFSFSYFIILISDIFSKTNA